MRYGWQLDVSFWNRLSLTCGTQDWKRIYLEDTYKHSVPRDSGVYLICTSAQDGLTVTGAAARLFKVLYTAVYVGQAINLRRRFEGHVRGYGNVLKARSIFRRLDYWYTCVIAGELDDLEQCLIDAIGPAANDQNVQARVGEPVPAGSLGKLLP